MKKTNFVIIAILLLSVLLGWWIFSLKNEFDNIDNYNQKDISKTADAPIKDISKPADISISAQEILNGNVDINIKEINSNIKAQLPEKDVKLKSIVITEDNLGYRASFYYSTVANKIIVACYYFNNKKIDNIRYINIEKGDMDKSEADRVLVAPEVSESMVSFGLDGALKKLISNNKYLDVKRGNSDVFSRMNVYLEYENAYGWVWKILFFSGEPSETTLQNEESKAVIFWVTPSEVSVNKAINLAQ